MCSFSSRPSSSRGASCDDWMPGSGSTCPATGWGYSHRLVPTASVVVTVTVLAGLLLLPAVRWRGLLVDAIASATYTQNWVLALRSVDYYADDKGAASPLQHVWSLSLQGQAFLLWPVLLVALSALARRTGWLSVRLAIGSGLGVLGLASFAWAVHSTGTQQAFAYFDGAARLWELALGGVLALVVHRVRVPGVVATLLGWLGVAGLLTGGLVLDVTGAFPGWAPCGRCSAPRQSSSPAPRPPGGVPPGFWAPPPSWPPAASRTRSTSCTGRSSCCGSQRPAVCGPDWSTVPSSSPAPWSWPGH